MKTEPQKIDPRTLIIATDMVDVTDPHYVEILIRADSRVVWVNVDGECKFRAEWTMKKPIKLIIQDDRTSIPSAAQVLGVSPIHDTAGDSTPANNPVEDPAEVRIRQTKQNE